MNVRNMYDAALEHLDSDAIRQQAGKLVEINLHPVVIPPTQEQSRQGEWVTTIGKRPTLKGWPEAALQNWIEPHEIPDGVNLGILCGTPVQRGGNTYFVADIDIDVAAAVPVFVSAFRALRLPPAFSWGRDGKPASHHLFVVDKPLFTTGGKAMYHGVAELRCQSQDGDYKPFGHQSVTFPSVWSKGDRIEVIRPEPDSAPEPPAVSADLLFTCYNTAVAAHLFALMMPEHPRNPIRCAFLQVAKKGGLSAEDAFRFLVLMNEFTVNPDEESKIRSDVFKDIYNPTKDPERHLAGFPKLLEHLGEQNRQTLTDIFALLGIHHRPATASVPTAGIPSNFEVKESGVYYVREPEGHDDEQKPFRICSKLEVISIVQSKDTEEWGIELQWTDMSGIQRTWTLRRGLLNNDASAIREELLQRGFQFIEPSKRGHELFVRYLMGCDPLTRKKSVTRVGWHGDAYVTPHHVFSTTNEQIVFQSQTVNCFITASSGTLEEWQSNLSACCVGNSRLLLTVSATFAAPLMRFVSAESGGINIVGTSSIGKTTAAIIAASAASNPEKYIQQWRATANGLESVAAQYNHGLLILDDLGQADPKDVGEVIYMIANQRGKIRMNRSGTMRTPYEWELIFLSTGEKDLKTHMQAGNARIKGGQSIRCLDIPADAESGYGLFEKLHGSTSGDAFSNRLTTDASHYYGTAFPAFIQKVIENVPMVKDALHKHIEAFQAQTTPPSASGEVSRAIRRFALIAAAGEIATSLSITGWPQGEAFRGVRKCFDSWLARRGGVTAGDAQNGIQQVRHFLELHGSSRFVEIGGTESFERITTNRCGFKEKVQAHKKKPYIEDLRGESTYDYFILPEAFKTEVCAGYDTKVVAKALADAGILTREADQFQVRKALPGLGRKRVYHITSKIFD